MTDENRIHELWDKLILNLKESCEALQKINERLQKREDMDIHDPQNPWNPFNPLYKGDYSGYLKSQRTWGNGVKKGRLYWDPNLIRYMRKD